MIPEFLSKKIVLGSARSFVLPFVGGYCDMYFPLNYSVYIWGVLVYPFYDRNENGLKGSFYNLVIKSEKGRDILTVKTGVGGNLYEPYYLPLCLYHKGTISILLKAIRPPSDWQVFTGKVRDDYKPEPYPLGFEDPEHYQILKFDGNNWDICLFDGTRQSNTGNRYFETLGERWAKYSAFMNVSELTDKNVSFFNFNLIVYED